MTDLHLDCLEEVELESLVENQNLLWDAIDFDVAAVVDGPTRDVWPLNDEPHFDHGD